MKISVLVILSLSLVFSLMTIVPEASAVTNEADISYNPVTHEISIEWDFGTRPSCILKTDVVMFQLVDGKAVKDYSTAFYTTNSSNIHTQLEIGMSLYDRNDDSMIVPCKGEFTFKITDFEIREGFDGFYSYTTFYERSNTTLVVLNEVSVLYSENLSLKRYSCNSFTLAFPTSDYYYDVNSASKIINDTIQCDYPTILFEGVHKIDYTIAVLETPKKKGGGCSGDCKAPTLGVDSTGKRFVDNGIVLNGEPVEVNYFYTHMPMQYTEIGKINHIELKIYENSGVYAIDYVQLGLGIKEIGTPLNEAQARFEIDIDSFFDDIENPRLGKLLIHDPDNIIGFTSTTLALADCGAVDEECLLVEIKWKYKAAPKYDVLAVNVWDIERNTINDYFNDGLHVVTPEIKEIPQKAYKYKCKDTPLEEIVGPVTRNNCHFRALTDIWK